VPVQPAPVLAVEADAPGTENLPVTASAAEPEPQPDSGPEPTADASPSTAPATSVGGNAGGGGSEYIAPNFNANYLSNPRPDYPALSTQLREQGAVKLRVHVTEDGRVDKVVLHRSSGYGRLDKAAVDVVWRYRFKPASRAGVAVAAWVVVPINFHIKS
jgi:protein TonB